MEDLLLKIKDFMVLLRAGHIENEEHAPLEINHSPTIAHPDCNHRLFNQILEEVFEWKEASNNYDLEEFDRKVLLLDAEVDVIIVLLQMVIANGHKDIFVDAINEVIQNNLTKFPNGKGSYNSDGKLMKPEGYKKPNLDKFIN